MHLYQSLEGLIPSGLRLGFDFDSVICDTSALFVREIRAFHDEQQTGVPIWPDMFTSGYDIQVPGFTNRQVWAEIIAPGLANTHLGQPVPGAVEFLRFWYGVTGEPITVITARRAENMQSVADFMANHIQVPARCIRAGGHAQKLGWCEAEGITDFVDDRYRTCQELSEAGITVWMIPYPWNTNRDTPNCFLGDWSDIFNYYYQLYLNKFEWC